MEEAVETERDRGIDAFGLKKMRCPISIVTFSVPRSSEMRDVALPR